MGDCTVTGDASGPPCFFSGFCLFLSSLALVYGSVSSKYNMLVCVVSLLCAHCGITWTTCGGACLISTHFYLLFVYMCLCLPLRSLCDALKLYLGIFVAIKWAVSIKQHFLHHTYRGEDSCNGRALGGRAQCGRDMRPERLISIPLPVNSLNLLPSPSRQLGKLPWLI